MKQGRVGLALLLVVGLAAAACGGDAGTQSPTAAAQTTAPVATPAPAAVPDAGGPAPDIVSVLSVEHEVDLLAQRDGVVTEIAQDEGSRVRAGVLLGRLDDRDLKAELARDQANLQVAESNVKYNEAELKARQAAYRRAQEMFRLGLNSEAELEEAEFRAKGVEYDLQSWHAQVDKAKAEIRLIEVELDKTRLQAPFDGVVARRYIRVGQTVQKGDKCFRLSQLGPLQVRFLVPETTSHRPQRGDAVHVIPLSDSQRVYQAKIIKVSPVVDAASGSYDVTAQLTEKDVSELRPGMSVRVAWQAGPPAH